MKKMISLLLALVLCLGLCACGKKTLGEEVSGGMSDEHVALVVDIAKEYVEFDTFKAMEEMTEYKGVKNAMYYQATFDEQDVELQLLLIELDLDADIVGWERLLVADLSDQSAYDVHALDMNNYMGEMDNYEDLLKQAFGGYDSFLMGRNPAVVTENEVRTPATAEQISEINAALGK